MKIRLLTYLKYIILITVFFIFLTRSVLGQTFAPAAGLEGSKAIHAENSLFIHWAKTCRVKRGYINFADTTQTFENDNKANYGLEADALDAPDHKVVSLGDGGSAILTFEKPVKNNEGYDFAVFENSFDDYFLELAFVEVSSDGENFVRFPAISLTQTDSQIDGFGQLEAANIYNLAGKYRAMYGTPFDLAELTDSTNIDINNITHIKIVDVVGSIMPDFASCDSQGNIINDPYPTTFNTGGFDLDAVGVIRDEYTSINDITERGICVYPNPAKNNLWIKGKNSGEVKIISLDGNLIINKQITNAGINVSALKSGIYFVKFNDLKKSYCFKVLFL